MKDVLAKAFQAGPETTMEDELVKATRDDPDVLKDIKK